MRVPSPSPPLHSTREQHSSVAEQSRALRLLCYVMLCSRGSPAHAQRSEESTRQPQPSHQSNPISEAQETKQIDETKRSLARSIFLSYLCPPRNAPLSPLSIKNTLCPCHPVLTVLTAGQSPSEPSGPMFKTIVFVFVPCIAAASSEKQIPPGNDVSLLKMLFPMKFEAARAR